MQLYENHLTSCFLYFMKNSCSTNYNHLHGMRIPAHCLPEKRVNIHVCTVIRFYVVAACDVRRVKCTFFSLWAPLLCIVGFLCKVFFIFIFILLQACLRTAQSMELI